MDATFIIQVLVSAILVLGLGIWAQAKHADYAPPKGILETILLVLFIEKSLEEEIDVHWFRRGGEGEQPEDDPTSLPRISQFLKRYSKYTSLGRLSPHDLLPDGEEDLDDIGVSIVVFLIMAVALLLIAPFFGLAWFKEIREEDEDWSAVAIVHPLERSHNLMQSLGLLLSILIWFVLIGLLVPGVLRIVLLILLCVPLGVVAFSILRLIIWQDQWKDWWDGQISMVLAQAAYKEDYDLYNRASAWSKVVDGKPTIPLTAIQRLILIVFALIQVLLTQAQPLIDRLLG
jgi:hypothetical protein